MNYKNRYEVTEIIEMTKEIKEKKYEIYLNLKEIMLNVIKIIDESK